MADSPVLYVYYRPDNDDAYPGVPNRHITEADWARFSPSQRRIVQEATTQDGYGRRKVWVHRDLVDETEQERADREAAEQAARDAYERGQSIVRWRDFEKMVPGPGEVIVGSADGPASVPVESIGAGADVVRGVGVTRIIASTDPAYPLQDGELLILLEDAPQFFTDFTDYQAADWVAPWGQQVTWDVVDDAAATGGKLLRSTATANGRKSLAWAGIGTAKDVEIVYRWRSPAPWTAHVRSALRVSGSAGAEYGYVLGHEGVSKIFIYQYTNGASAVLGEVPPPVVPQANTWYISRARVTAQGLGFRTWADGTPEPATWDASNTSVPAMDRAGFAGILIQGTGTVDLDWVGVAFDGEAAPMGAV